MARSNNAMASRRIEARSDARRVFKATLRIVRAWYTKISWLIFNTDTAKPVNEASPPLPPPPPPLIRLGASTPSSTGVSFDVATPADSHASPLDPVDDEEDEDRTIGESRRRRA